MGRPPGPWICGARGWYPPGPGAEPDGFAATTRVISSDGLVEFGQLDNGCEISVLNSQGHWTTGRVEILEPRRMWQVTIERTRGQHTVYAGAGQLWPINSPQRRLRGNEPLTFRTDALALIGGSPFWKPVTVNPSERVQLDPDGILHGIVFGDGAYHRQSASSGRTPYCQVCLCNDPAGCDSRRLSPLFEQRGFRAVFGQRTHAIG